MSAQHTPGPWEVDTIRNEGEYGNNGPDTRSGFSSFVVVDPEGRALFDSLNSGVAEVEEEYGEDDMHAWDARGKANLTLAAAAPDMLEVLEVMAAYFGGAKDRFGRPDQSANEEMREARARVQALAVRFGVASGHHTVTDQCAAVMRAASAKATGSSA